MQKNILISGYELDEISGSIEGIGKYASKITIIAGASYSNFEKYKFFGNDQPTIEVLDRFSLRQGLEESSNSCFDFIFNDFETNEFKILIDMFERMTS